MNFSFRKTVLAVAVAALLFSFSASARAELTEDQVKQIVHDYIMDHPEDILASVQKHQEKSMKERSKDALKASHDDLYNDKNVPFAGNPNGDVTVVEFFDYNCGYCKKVLPHIMELIEEDKNVRVLFREFPILGPTSETAAKWALAAHKQGKYFAYHQELMKNKSPITDALLQDIAKKVGLNLDKAKADADSSDVLIEIEKNRSLAAKMDVRGTPAFVVGDAFEPGAIGLDSMKKLIARAREAKKEAPKKEKAE